MSDKTAGRYDLQMRTNETFELKLVYRDANKLPIDLTGYTVRMQVRDKPGGTIILDSNNAGNSVTIDGPNGMIDIVFPLATMNTVTAPGGVYDVVLTDPSAVKVDALIDGAVAIVEGVTI